MSVVRKITLGTVGVALGLLAIGFFLPGTAEVARSTVIDAPAHTVFAVIDGFGSFRQWWPWRTELAEGEYVVDGPPTGEGARLSWSSGNPQIGSGYQEVVASERFHRVETYLDLGNDRTGEVVYEVESVEEGTLVRWVGSAEFGRSPLERYLGLMYERWIGADFESGLGRLKALAEALPATDWTGLDIGIVEVEERPLIFVSKVSAWDVESISEAFGAARREVSRFIKSHDLEQAGPPVALSTYRGEEEWGFEAGIPVAAVPQDIPFEPDALVQLGEIPGGRVVRAVSVGPYAKLSAEWEKVRAWMVTHGLEEVGPAWEEYVSDPADTPEDELVTNLYALTK